MTVTRESFNSLYASLSDAWDTHHRLRSMNAPIAELAAASARLDQARAAMWDWHKCHTSVI